MADQMEAELAVGAMKAGWTEALEAEGSEGG